MTNILFLCKSNVGRSQMAEALYNHLTKTNNATSAGLAVEEKYLNKKEGKVAPDVTAVVKKALGTDISNNNIKQVTPTMIKEADNIVCLEANKNLWPTFVKNATEIEIWAVEDPRGTGETGIKKSFDDIQLRMHQYLEG